MPLLEVTNLRTSFHTRHGIVRAVNDVSFALEKGDTLIDGSVATQLAKITPAIRALPGSAVTMTTTPTATDT